MANRFAVNTPFTWNATAGTKWSTTSGGASGAAVPTTADDVFFDGNSGVGTVTSNAAAQCKSLSFAGFGGTFTGVSGLTISDGGLVWGAGMTLTYSGILTFASTSGTTWDITSNGVPTLSNVIFNGVGGVWRLGDAFSTTLTTTLTNGTFNTNGKNFTTGRFSSANANIRTITMDNSLVTLTSTGTIWSTNTVTNLTFSATGSTLKCTDGTATACSIFGQSVQFGVVQITASTSAFTLADLVCTDLDFTGSGVTVTSGPITIGGNLTCSATTTWAASGTAVTFNATAGTKIITSNGVTIDRQLTFDGVGGTWQLADGLTLGATRFIVLTHGTLNTNGKAVSCNSFTSNQSNVRGLTLGATVWSLTGNGTVWNLTTPTNMTLSAGASTIKLTESTAQPKQFAGGGLTYGTLTFDGTGTGTFTINDTNTFANLTGVNPPHTIILTVATTQTITGSFGFVGTAGNLFTFQSSSAGTQAIVSKPGNNVAANFLSLQDIKATGGARWFAGASSTNVSGNNGWRFAGSSNRCGLSGSSPFVSS